MVYKTIYNEDFNIGTTLTNEIIDFSNIDYYGMKYSVNSPDIVLPYTLSLDDNRIIYEKDENGLLTTELVISSDSSSVSKMFMYHYLLEMVFMRTFQMAASLCMQKSTCALKEIMYFH